MMNKLKILPPTLREKKRYVAFKIFSENRITKDEIIVYLWDNLIDIFGEIYASKINIWLINFKFIKYEDNKNEYKAIIKCQKGYEEDVITMLNSLTYYKNKRIVIHTLLTSATIKTLNDKFNLL